MSFGFGLKKKYMTKLDTRVTAWHSARVTLRLPPIDAKGSRAAPDPRLTAELHKWDAILAAEGFQDIEHRNPNGTLDLGRLDGCNPERNYSRKLRDRRADYYRQAEHWLVAKPDTWQTWLRGTRYRTKRIWRLHAAGANNREIAKAVGLVPSVVGALVRRERQAMLAAGAGAASRAQKSGRAVVTELLAEAPSGHLYGPDTGQRTPIRNSGYGSDHS